MDFVDQFQRLVKLLLKWALIVIVIVVALSGVIAGGVSELARFV